MLGFAIGAGFAEIALIFASFTSSFSILRCSLGRPRLMIVMTGLFHTIVTACASDWWKFLRQLPSEHGEHREAVMR